MFGPEPKFSLLGEVIELALSLTPSTAWKVSIEKDQLPREVLTASLTDEQLKMLEDWADDTG